MTDVQDVTVFGSQLYYLVIPRDRMTEGETYFKRVNHFQWMTIKIDLWVHLMVLSKQQGQTNMHQY